MSYRSGPLSEATERWLPARQARIDALSDPATRYKSARALFSNKTGRQFDEIRSSLARMSPPGRACFDRERDRYRDIDHIRPIRFFPELCFNWQNYVYACSRCNQDAKNDRYGVVNQDGELIELDRSTSLDTRPPAGLDALINIRTEDPASDPGDIYPLPNSLRRRGPGWRRGGLATNTGGNQRDCQSESSRTLMRDHTPFPPAPPLVYDRPHPRENPPCPTSPTSSPRPMAASA